MPKQAPNATIDAMLDYVAGATAMHVISAYALDDTRATVVGNSLANVTVASGDFTKADGASGNGRQVTVAAKSGVSVTATNTATHVALVDASTVRYVTTCTSQSLTSGNTVNLPSWVISVADPT